MLNGSNFIQKLNQRIIKWQENHLIFSDTLNTARANARKNNATELSNNDVSKIRLAEGTLESHARTLVLAANFGTGQENYAATSYTVRDSAGI